jgi:hypothetical protein
MTTIKITANRENARHSSGAKSFSSKKNSSRNATKHGLFAHELILRDDEIPLFQALSRALYAQHSPKTEAQKIACEAVVFCTWRVRLAARQEMRQVEKLLDASKTEGTAQPEEQSPTVTNLWYAASKEALRGGIRFLSHVLEDYKTNHRLRPDWKESFDRAFGAEFYPALAKWTPASYDAILLTNDLIRHALTFRHDLFPDGKKPPDVVVDSQQGDQMVIKLIERELQHLFDLRTSWEQRASSTVGPENPSRSDFTPRYFTTALRDLHRMVDWLVELKEKGV